MCLNEAGRGALGLPSAGVYLAVVSPDRSTGVCLSAQEPDTKKLKDAEVKV